MHEFHAKEAQSLQVKKNDEQFIFTYSQFNDADLKVVVTVKMSDISPMIHWNISVENNTSFVIDHIDFPNVVVPDDLIATGGTAKAAIELVELSGGKVVELACVIELTDLNGRAKITAPLYTLVKFTENEIESAPIS